MTTRIFLFTDIHANLPAMNAILAAIKEEAPDRVVFLGDMVDIGPHPSEVVDSIMAHTDWSLIRGNHEGYMNGEVRSRIGIDGEERSHHAWTRQQLRPDQIEAINTRCQWQIEETIEDVPLRFIHYARQQPPHENRYVQNLRPKPAQLRKIFHPQDRQLICFGHLHYPHQLQRGQTQYLSVGAAGPSRVPKLTHYAMVTLSQGKAKIQQKFKTFDDSQFFTDMEDRNVPGRLTIYRIFFGNRSS